VQEQPPRLSREPSERVLLVYHQKQMRKPGSPRLLANRTALITGASRGIGLAIAEALAQEGCNLILTSRDAKALTKSARRLERHGAQICTHTCDVRDPHSVDALFTLIRRIAKRLDILINNAGIAQPNLTVENLPYSVWKEVLETNLDGTFLITQASLALMKRGATIVNNLSIAATRVFPGTAAYNASKHGALGFTNTLREELRGKGIRVIALLPGATDTDIWNILWPNAPRKKMMSPKTIATAVVNALLLPEDSTLEELTIMPTVGTL
jgi:NAD(P)-dependent dehydrogenase (short-subunit alcohol dehydrogenase family)